jgi:HAE1 family hydrophobic/amphiphilic exporter-1
MNLSAIFIKRPVTTTLLMLGILVFGGLAYQELPVADLPSVDFPAIRVSASLPGASAETWRRRWPCRSRSSSRRSRG